MINRRRGVKPLSVWVVEELVVVSLGEEIVEEDRVWSTAMVVSGGKSSSFTVVVVVSVTRFRFLSGASSSDAGRAVAEEVSLEREEVEEVEEAEEEEEEEEEV
jgi:hypothetical protein